MSEFVNVTEVEKLPLNKVDSLIAIDYNNNIKRTAIKIDQEVIPESTNPVSSKGVYDIIVVLGNDFGEAVSDLENHLGAFEDDIREEISALNEEYATKDWVENKGYLTSIPAEYITEAELNAKKYLTSIPSEYVTDAELTNKGFATEAYVSGLIGDIDSVLDQINGEVV